MSRKAVEAELYSILDTITHDPTNSTMYRELFETFDDTQFKNFFSDIADKKRKLPVFIPNHGAARMKMETILAEADRLGLVFYDTLQLETDGLKYESEQEAMILCSMVRRLAQTLESKLSVPEDDAKVDALSGQVRGDDKAASVGQSEIGVLNDTGLRRVAAELTTVRGGDSGAYSYLKAATAATGSPTLEGALQARTGVGSRRQIKTFLLGKHIGNTL